MLEPRASVPGHIQENIDAVQRMREESEREVGTHQRVIERGARALARPRTLYVLIFTVAGWVGLNLSLMATGRAPIDAPPFFWTQGAIALYAALVSTMVLIAQARQDREDQRRAQLELHVALLAEQKTTKIVSLLEELRRDLPNVRDREDPVANAMQQQVDPHDVHAALSK